MRTHRLLFRSFAFKHVCCSYIYFSAKLAYFSWSKTCPWKIATYSVRVGTDNSKAICPTTFFCPCNAAHHASKLFIQKAAIYLLCLDSSIQPAWSCTDRAKLWCIYLWRKAVDGNAHTRGPSKLIHPDSGNERETVKSSEFSVSTEHRLMAWHQVAQKPVLHRASILAEVQKWKQYCIPYLLPPPFPQSKIKHNFLISWTFYANQFQQRITNAVSSEQ